MGDGVLLCDDDGDGISEKVISIKKEPLVRLFFFIFVS